MLGDVDGIPVKSIKYNSTISTSLRVKARQEQMKAYQNARGEEKQV